MYKQRAGGCNKGDSGEVSDQLYGYGASLHTHEDRDVAFLRLVSPTKKSSNSDRAGIIDPEELCILRRGYVKFWAFLRDASSIYSMEDRRHWNAFSPV